MSARRIEPGMLCVVVRSHAGNEGRIVVTIRKVEAGTVHGLMCFAESGWMVECKTPLRHDLGGTTTVGVFPEGSLRPITPPPGADASPGSADAEREMVHRMRRLAEFPVEA